ncbi:DUF4232 domain-containing protein [Streptomyces sp. NPDC002580]|uniref:DUF4232 domain-containing protein n=1 Tax=Streptomyces sp. NPDC002580 TaxID=3364653 RepID=UPI0036C91A04
MTAVSAAALLMTACGPEEDGAGSAASPSGSTAGPTASSTGTPAPATPSGGTGASAKPAGKPASVAPGSSSTTAAPTVKACQGKSLKSFLYQADVRPEGTGIGAVIAEFTNMSAAACSVQGHPTVAGAPNGSPDKGRPLTVTPTGTASKVLLAPGGKAWVKVTFVQVQGEGDGYCVSGADPVTYPTLVVALPSGGAHQLALDDGALAECDDKATVTAVTATKPS